MVKQKWLLFIFLSIFIFDSKAQEKPIFSFGIAADVQYCDCESKGQRYYRSSLKKLNECVDVFNSKNLSFVIQLGDLIDKKIESFDSVLTIYNRLKMKQYHVLGNHDFSVDNRYKNSILNRLDLKNGYYDFKLKSWRFIVLDGNDISFHRFVAGSDNYQKAEKLYNKIRITKSDIPEWNGSIGRDQLNWLKAKLVKSSKIKEKVVIFCHYPIFPKNIHCLWNDDEVLNIIESFDCVVAYINGHNHAGNYAFHNHIHYLTIQGMVETIDTNAFAIIEVYPDKLNVVGYGREHSRILTINK